MEIASWIVIGLVFGLMARIAMPGPAAGGKPVAILVGVSGAIIGGIVGAANFENGTAPVSNSALMAVAGSMYPLFLYRCFAMRFANCARSPSPPFVDRKDESVRENSSTDMSNNTVPSRSPMKHLKSPVAPLRIGI